ncbi:hypothetical protein J8TS2_22830 [Lederbergia ruris]|uniref:HTH cro/C1-type domain-containing protein n=1 Tax=Lederbergia ruris TaxID=217495 RepID=A0ABQ4KJ29_9BACI|nr:helix-turn-helix transcriptional regulator [Lederbergia ruris]GIN57964.1 hypothetical protein J8TS2_22830 [Lederbergia ruris]
MEIGKRIRHLRIAKNLKISELAKKSFVSQSYLSDIERGRTAPSLDKLNIICSALGISLSEFFGTVPTMSSEIIRLVENAQKLTNQEIELLSNFLESMLARQKKSINE